MTSQEREQQRRDALKKANAVRTGRKRIKEQLVVGEADARELLNDPPPLIHEVPVRDFLTWVPKIGKSKAGRIIAEAGVYVGPSTPLCRLSPVTREKIAAKL